MCLNPNSRDCACFDCLDERYAVSAFRNAELWASYDNSLAKWMNSDGWSEVSVNHTRGSRGTWFTEHDVYWGNEVSGEIHNRQT